MALSSKECHGDVPWNQLAWSGMARSEVRITDDMVETKASRTAPWIRWNHQQRIAEFPESGSIAYADLVIRRGSMSDMTMYAEPVVDGPKTLLSPLAGGIGPLTSGLERFFRGEPVYVTIDHGAWLLLYRGRRATDLAVALANNGVRHWRPGMR